MSTRIKTCTIVPVPEDKFIDAAIAAIKENPANAPMRTLPAGLGAGIPGQMEIALLTRTLWKPGRELRVKFQGGESRVRERIIPFAKQWHDHMSVRLNFVGENEDADIRISFSDTGSWSYLGTTALVIDANKPTMNYGWLTAEGPDDEYSRVVLHEFGHALGAIHEHSHPDQGIPWDKEKVYQYYAATQGWSRTEVDAQLFRRYSQTETNFSAYDPASIMHYPVDNALTIGDFEIGWNRVLSPTDRAHMNAVYPPSTQAPQLSPSVPVNGDIGMHGEVDSYTFTIANSRDVLLLTHGNTDTLMSLYGPNDPAALIAWDDDSGERRNARLHQLLARGDYHVRIRHWHPQGTGQYQIELRLA